VQTFMASLSFMKDVCACCVNYDYYLTLKLFFTTAITLDGVSILKFLFLNTELKTCFNFFNFQEVVRFWHPILNGNEIIILSWRK